MNTIDLARKALTALAAMEEAISDPEELPTMMDSDLIDLGAMQTELVKLARENMATITTAAVHRLDAIHADVIAGDYGKLTRAWKNAYAPDAETLSSVIPARDVDDLLEYVPEHTEVVPGQWKVKSTVKLANYAKKLGDTPQAKAIEDLLHKTQTLGPVTFEAEAGVPA